MGTCSSGYYSIDSDYNIVGFNNSARDLYPSLKLGEKCYKCLMGLDSPCPPCPVANGIYGPKTYLDPIRHIYETVDAVETILPDGSTGHTLVFSTVAEGERLASSIPTGESSLRLIGAINLLATRYSVVLGVELQSNRISIYRQEKLFGTLEIALSDNMTYDEAVAYLISRYVYAEERNTIQKQLEPDNIRSRLEHTPSFKIHCRILLDQMHYFYLLIARNGEADSYEDFVVAIACEDDDVSSRRVYEKQLEALISSIRHAAGYFHLDITEDKILKIGGTSTIVDTLDAQYSIDALMGKLSTFILKSKDRRAFLRAYNLSAMKREYESGKVEIIRESRCNYDDNIARWSRYTLRLLTNPSNNHLEGVFYGEDITHDREAYETQVSIVQALSSNYLDVLLLNVREQSATLIKHEGSLPEIMPLENGHTYNYAALMGTYIRKYVHPEDREMMTRAIAMDYVLEKLARGSEYTGNYRIIRDGVVHTYRFRFIKNEEYGIVVLGLLNVDDIVLAEIEHQQKLQAALDKAKRASTEKSLFLARMSHDMRTPLNGILGLLEIDKHHADDVEYLKANREKAITTVNHLVALVNDVLDMAKIEEGNLILSHEPFNILDEGAEGLVLIGLQAQTRGIQLEIVPQSWDPRLNYVYGSPLHLRRAMMNIYSNCIKYNREGGSITTDVQVLDHNETHVTFQWTISDTGIGMSQEFLAHVFEPFSQENTDARSVYQGTGLGMGISKAIFEKMGGSIEVSSVLGKGSTFVITIPFELADPGCVEQTSDTADRTIRGMRLLLVEDNDLNRDIAETILSDEGAIVTCAVNGQEALDVLHQEGPFDVILMDVMMPIMNGHEATRQMRRLGVTTPIIAMTANAFAEDIQKSLDAGMNAHLTKPLDIGKMLHTIASYKKA